MAFDTMVWGIPLLPIAGFLVNGFVGRRLPRPFAGILACATVFGSFVLSVQAFRTVGGSGTFVSATTDWIRVPGLGGGAMEFLAQHSLTFDRLSCLMALVVTGVGFLIHVYSLGYMADDKRYARYFSYLNLFTGFMLILVLGSNLFLMFVGWEGVGLCSYLLIGFWFEKSENAAAGKKAFLVNRVGDFFFTVGVLALFVYLGNQFGRWTVDIAEIKRIMAANPGALSIPLLTAVGIFLFGGATGKSAQIPLYVWLPDAMAGPTPVSALIHAATMVTAGVYMVARMGFLFELAPIALAVVATVGAVTAFFAGTIAICQNDIKKVLAYSTVSQLGFMFLGVGSGYFAAGIFHLMTHAFFKACLFLGSGSVIHGMGGEQDIRKMGGLFPKMKITAVTFLVASLALAGLPFVTSGFWSKEGILGAAWSSHALPWPWLGKGLALLGFAAAGLTAFYMTRLVWMIFFGEAHWKTAHADEGHGHGSHDDDADHGDGHGEPHESPWTMTVPLMVLAALSVVGGFAWFFDVGHWLGPLQPQAEPPHGPGWFLPLSFLVSLGGIGIGYYLFAVRREIPERFVRDNPGLHGLVLNKYYVDERYQEFVVEPLLDLNEAAGRFDNAVIDGTVNGAASATATTSQSTGYFDNEIVDGGVNGTGAAARRVGAAVRRLQTGNIRSYLTGAIVGGLFVIAAFCLYVSRDVLRDMIGRIF